jgi:hypothetical protein
MSYSILLSDLSKTRSIVIQDSVPNNETSLTLSGPSTFTFGKYFWDNLLHLLENFSNETSPINPLEGQLWYNSATQLLNVCTSVIRTVPTWVPIEGSGIVDLSNYIDMSKPATAKNLKLGIPEPTVTIYSGVTKNDLNACTKKFVDDWHGGVKTGSANNMSWVIYPNKFTIIQGIKNGNVILPFEMRDVNYSVVLTSANRHVHYKVFNKTTKTFTTNSENWVAVGIAL